MRQWQSDADVKTWTVDITPLVREWGEGGGGFWTKNPSQRFHQVTLDYERCLIRLYTVLPGTHHRSVEALDVSVAEVLQKALYISAYVIVAVWTGEGRWLRALGPSCARGQHCWP